jgi:RNA polymerase sigma factor (sigma-70 family)
MTDDPDLLRLYVGGSEDAFRALVERHGRLVYSVCLRQLRRADLAEDATQITFALLAAKAAGLTRTVALSAWLQKAAWHASRRLGRSEGRRERHEKGAGAMRDTLSQNSAWDLLRPHVDEALSALPVKYRDPICMRFLERRPLEDVGRRLGCGTDAARMRISRGLEKLKAFLDRRGVRIATAVLAVLLGERLLEGAPAGLAQRVASGALSGRGASAALLAGLGRRMAWPSVPILAASLLFLFAGAATVRFARSPDREPAAVASAASRVAPSTELPATSNPSTSSARSDSTVTKLVGRVLCQPGGIPASGLRVSFNHAEDGVPTVFATTGEDGSFEFVAPPGSVRVTLNCRTTSSPGEIPRDPVEFVERNSPPPTARFYYPRHEFGATHPRDLSLALSAGETTAVEFHVRRARLISGWISSEDGVLPTRAYAILRPHPRLRDHGDPWQAIYPDGDGFYEAAHTYEGGFTLEGLAVEGDGYLPGWSRGFKVPEQGDVTQINVRLTRGVCVLGGVEDESGRPIAATLRSRRTRWGDDPPHVPRITSPAGKTDAQGRFRMPGFAEGSYLLVIEAGSDSRTHAPEEVALQIPPGSPIVDAGRIVLRKGGVLKGRVVDSLGEPVRNAYVGLSDVGAEGVVPSTSTDADGRFVFPHVRMSPEGRVGGLTFSASGFLRKDLSDIPCGPELIVSLKRACGLKVNLLWTGKGPGRTVYVNLSDQAGSLRNSYERNLISGESDVVESDDLSPGEYRLRVSEAGGETLFERELSLTKDSIELEVRW